LPATGRTAKDVLDSIAAMQKEDVDWRNGRAWFLVFHADEELLDLVEKAYCMALPTNGLGLYAFPSLARMEKEVVTIAGQLLGAPDAVGSMTSGGSESIFLAVKTARDRARALRPDIEAPEMVLSYSAHPAFDKAAHYLQVRSVRVELQEDFTVSAEDMAAAITPSTILLVASAPEYPFGTVDPVQKLAQIALKRNLMLHVDACMGGFLLPFMRRLGRNVPSFDFSVDGVTSMSADLHKFGYAAKGASVVLYRNPDIFRHQPFAFEAWPGGKYEVPNVTGTRPGGAIAAAWAALQYLGLSGYERLTARSLEAKDRLVAGIEELGYRICGHPPATLFAFTSDSINVADVAAGMGRCGWLVGLQEPPLTLHLTVTAAHLAVVDQFLTDLRSVSTAVVSGAETGSGLRGRYA
jgi:glutamate/tyrosine decarboxylase-like PLP-dependent enzyme